MNLSTSATANVYFANSSNQLTRATADVLGQSVRKIVSDVLLTNFREEVCVGRMIDAYDELARVTKEKDSDKKDSLIRAITLLEEMCKSNGGTLSPIDQFIEKIR